MKQTKTDNETLTGVWEANGAALVASAQATAKAAQDWIDAETDLVNGFVPEGSSTKIKATGITVEDRETYDQVIASLDAARAALKARYGKPAGSRGPAPERAKRFQLVHADTKLPVQIGDGSLGTFANKVNKLRGPAYRASIADLDTVCLIDTATGEVVVAGSEMEFAAAPGRPAKS